MNLRTLPGGLVVAGHLLRSRVLCVGLPAAALVHAGTVLAGWPGWPCPVLAATGVPCPGCGLGRGCAFLLRGEVRAALRIHAFSPFALAATALFLVAACLPEAARCAAADCAERLEQRTGLSAWLLGGIFFYWLARLALDGPGLLRLLR